MQKRLGFLCQLSSFAVEDRHLGLALALLALRTLLFSLHTTMLASEDTGTMARCAHRLVASEASSRPFEVGSQTSHRQQLHAFGKRHRAW
jgi:hypothetical protein